MLEIQTGISSKLFVMLTYSFTVILFEDKYIELKDFVKFSLSQIAEGIVGVNEMLSNTDGIVNPPNIVVNTVSSQAYGKTRKPSAEFEPTRVVEKVEFDVAVTVQEGEATNAGIKVSVMSIGLGAGGESISQFGSKSRIKFSVLMVFPSKKYNKRMNFTPFLRNFAAPAKAGQLFGR